MARGVVIKITEVAIIITDNSSLNNGNHSNPNTIKISILFLRKKNGGEINWGIVNYNILWVDKTMFRLKSQHSRCKWLQLITLSIWVWYLHLLWCRHMANLCLHSFLVVFILIFILSFISSQGTISHNIQEWCLHIHNHYHKVHQ